MSDSRAVSGLDRLPWLSDEPARKVAPAPRRTPRDLKWLATAAVLAVAIVFFWLGSRTEAPTVAPPSATVSVPQPARVQRRDVAPPAQPEVAPATAPELHQSPAPQVRIPAQPVVRKVIIREIVRQVVTQPAQDSEKAPIAPVQTAPQPRVAPHAAFRPWPPRVVAGAYGRLVQIGAYGSRIQAKRGWVSMVRAYPGVSRLPAVVVITHNSHGRLFYRFQVGTTSQAHSEVLCQRMERIGLSCAVVGLPWKDKVER